MTNNQQSIENEFIEYLEKIKFEKHLKYIKKKLKNQKVIIYGAGTFFQTILNKYNLVDINIIAVADRKFINHKQDEIFHGYRVCAPDEMPSLSPDYVLVGMLKFVKVIEELEEQIFQNTNIKVKPLINKPILELWKEIWD